jgi:hypothetical protein
LRERERTEDGKKRDGHKREAKVSASDEDEIRRFYPFLNILSSKYT